jgi:hypothetical protein
MRVTDLALGRDTEAIGPALWGGEGEVYVVDGKRLDSTSFRKRFLPQPERRKAERRATDGRRWRDYLNGKYEDLGRKDYRRVHCRRVRDRLTEQEILALGRGIQFTV